jgi:hypothetical protein
MKRNITALLITCITLFSCTSATPEEYFGQAVLNCNYLFGFAGSGMERELSSPSEKLIDEKTLATAPMKRAEVVKARMERVEEHFAKVKKLSSTDETKDMLTASIALYDFVLPVYKNEYTQLAVLYDNGASVDKIEALEKTIREKYEEKFVQLYDKVWDAGKIYAVKHGMKVKEVNPSPSY